MMAYFVWIVYIILAYFVPNVHLPDNEQEKLAPQLKGDCPKYVDEAEDLRCECVSPPSVKGAKLTWVGYSDSSILTIANVSRDDNMRTFTCKMEYEKKTYEKNYTLQVAYGPKKDGISITPVSLTFNVTANGTNPAPRIRCSLGSCPDGNVCTTPLTRTEKGWITNDTCTIINTKSNQNPLPTEVIHIDLVAQKTFEEQQEYPAVLENNVVNGWMVGAIVSIVFNVIVVVAFVLVFYKPRCCMKLISLLPFAKAAPVGKGPPVTADLATNTDTPAADVGNGPPVTGDPATTTDALEVVTVQVSTNMAFASGERATNPSASGVLVPKENDNSDRIGQHNAANSFENPEEGSKWPGEMDPFLPESNGRATSSNDVAVRLLSDPDTYTGKPVLVEPPQDPPETTSISMHSEGRNVNHIPGTRGRLLSRGLPRHRDRESKVHDDKL